MKRHFFIGSIGKPGEGYDDENWERCIALNAHVMHEDTKQKGVFEKVALGDICFLKYKDLIIAFGEVSEVLISTEESLDGWTYIIKVHEWFFFSDDKKSGVNKYGIAEHTYPGAGQMGTIKQLYQDYSLIKMREIAGKDNKLYKKIVNEINMEKYSTLLHNNYNLILSGAPGTGKTYLAKQIAAQMIVSEDYSGELENDSTFKSHVGFTQFHPSYDYTDFVEGLRPTKEANGFVRTDGIFKAFCKEAIEKNDGKPYIFIIDEINRGEISKIFGELFFSVDPGYRGKAGKVKTQYQNMIEGGDVFKDGFYVPENVYIIGTMNDIDRSVESMDFAFRRRFAFIEIKAMKNTAMLDTLDENIKNVALNRMKHLNYIIWHKEKGNEPQDRQSIEGLSSAYHIGASYFLKLKNYNGDFNSLWSFHIEGVLREYLRGMEDLEENIERLKKAFDDDTDTDY